MSTSPVLYADRNLLLADQTLTGGTLHGISAQRGDVTTLGVATTPPFALNQNVACALSPTGAHALGSVNATHSFYQYPLDSEFSTYAGATPAPVPCKTMLRGTPGDVAVLLVAVAPTALPIPPYGTLYCDLGGPHALLSAPTAIGANGLLGTPVAFELAGPFAFPTELCLQGITLSGSTLRLSGSAAEPMRCH